jgi:Trypsin-like peptidase domain/FHA domain
MMTRKGVVGTLILVLTFIGLFSSYARGENAEETLLWKIKPATVLIQQYNTADFFFANQKFSAFSGVMGSGFIVNPDGYIVTNGHVVQDYYESTDKQLKRKLVNSIVPQILQQIVSNAAQQKKVITEAEVPDLQKKIVNALSAADVVITRHLEVILQNGENYPAEVKKYSPPIFVATNFVGKGYISQSGGAVEEKGETGKDVAVLKIEATNLPVAKLGDSDALHLADTIYTVGFPGVVVQHPYLSKKTATDPTVTIGKVSGTKLDMEGTNVIQTDAAITHGNSGGPAYNSKGEVVGITTFGSVPQGGSQEIAGFNFLVPINTAKEFIREAGVELGKESLFNKIWAETTDLYAHGQYKEALNKVDEVLRFFPNLPDAKNLQLRAQEQIMTKGIGDTGTPRAKIISLVVALMLISGIGFALLRRRKTVPISVPQTTRTQQATRTQMVAALGSIQGKSGLLMGKSYDIPSTGLKIGREPGKNNLVIDDDRISREHVWIGQEGGRVVIRDLNSLNGTFLNEPDGNRIKEETLKDGDVIIIGKGDFASFIYKSGS